MSSGGKPSFLEVSDLRLENCILWLGHSLSVIHSVAGSSYSVISFHQSHRNLRLLHPLPFCSACLNLANEFKSHAKNKPLERRISIQTAAALQKTDLKIVLHYNRKSCFGLCGLWSIVMELLEHVICLGNNFTEAGFYEILWRQSSFICDWYDN